MLTPAPATWIVRGATFALWALAAGSAAYWGLKLSAAAPSVNAPLAPARPVVAAEPATIARLLGSAPAAAIAAAPPALASRFRLLGVAAGASSGGGAAVISVDGKPARSFRVGGVIDEGYVLQSVRARQAVVAAQGTGQPVLTLELPQARADATRPMTVPPPPATTTVIPPQAAITAAPPPMPPAAETAPQPPQAPQAPTAAPR